MHVHVASKSIVLQSVYNFPLSSVEPTALQLIVTFLEKAGCVEGQVYIVSDASM